MKDNYSFVNIRKRQDKLEDYTTELFVFLLNYLKYNNSPILEKILYEFWFRNKVDFDNLEFYTQQRLSHHDTKVIVDILIKYKTIKTIIEVKINSPLNMYKRNGKELKQIEYYEGIPDVETVELIRQ